MKQRKARGRPRKAGDSPRLKIGHECERLHRRYQETIMDRLWLWSGPMRFGVASIHTHADGTYEPNPNGRPAFIVPASPVTEETLFEDHDPEDLVAFTLATPERWWVRLGVCPVLNQLAVERASLMREPLTLWGSPLAWLQAMGEGAVILDPTTSLRLWLGGVGEIQFEGLPLAERIVRPFMEPIRNPPRFLVRSQIEVTT
jgi:hypothetical protein